MKQKFEDTTPVTKKTLYVSMGRMLTPPVGSCKFLTNVSICITSPAVLGTQPSDRYVAPFCLESLILNTVYLTLTHVDLMPRRDIS